MDRSPLLALALILLSLAAAPGAHGQAQGPVTALEVRRACLHPSALPRSDSVEEFSGDSIRYDRRLNYLCYRMSAPARMADWSDTTLVRPWLAAAADRSLVPTVQEVRRYGDEAGAQLRRWRRLRPERQFGDIVLAANAIRFAEGSAEIDPGDSALVRQLAATIRRRLEANPNDVVFLHGRTSLSGGALANADAALRRANTLLRAVLDADPAIDATRLRPVATPRDEAIDPTAAATRLDAGREELASDTAQALLDRSADVTVQSDALLSLPPQAPLLDADLAVSAGGGGSGRASLAVAISEVVIDRAEAQVHAFVVEEATGRLCSGQYLELMQNTCAAFGPGAQPLFRAGLGSIRGALRSDLQRAVPLLTRNQLTEIHQRLDAPSARVSEGVAMAVYLLGYLEKVAAGRDPLQAMGDLRTLLSTVSSLGETEISRAALLIGPLVAAYGRALEDFRRIRGADLSPADLAAVAGDAMAYSLRAQLVNTQLQDPKKHPDVRKLFDSVGPIVELARSLEDTRRRLGPVLESGQAGDRLRALTELYTPAVNLVIATLPPRTMDPAVTAQFRLVGAASRDLIAALAAGQYRSAMLHALQVARGISPDAVGRSGVEDYARECGGEGRSREGELVPATLGCLHRFAPERMRVLAFAAEFVSAGDQAAAQDAVSRFVNQSRDYRSKRVGDRRGFVTVNAYLGASVAHEDPEAAGQSTPAGVEHRNYGLYLPIGIETGYRFGGSGKDLWPRPRSVSLFFQVIDLGSLAALRLGGADDDVDRPEPELSQFFSPGLFAVTSLGRWPVSVGGGWSWVPRAQEVGAGDDVRTVGATRASVFLAVDVPLFP